MNSLEFINIDIAIVNSNYKKHIEFGQTNLAISDVRRLQALQRIKTELEAWEVCKQYLVDMGNTYELEISYWYNEKEYKTLKKALEVEDEESI